MAGGRIDIEVGLDMKSLPAQLQAGAQPALGMASKIAGAIGLTFGAAAAGAAVKQIITTGNDYTNTLNTMQAVSQATSDQMAAVGDRAKQLGNDIDLPGMSASDAAMAMTELAKGGFSVQQSMDAAKGTLQLAAAAQIDAGTAATIQSQALQAFGLDASYAATAADVLANTANASSAEMTDVANGLQQAGTVANQFGVGIEDTATALGLFANAGITGSDAGTLLKSALLALTDQGNPAQGAIEELGLTVYNAKGEFVGLGELFGQLEVASKSMTDEQYQAATATLFGSDAMRLAGVAAEQGRAGYDAMRDAVDRQGAAADVAAAKTQGLPGAMGAMQNSVETLSLEIYDLIDGPLGSLATSAAETIGNATPQIVDGLSTVGSVVGDLGKAFLDLPGSVQVAVGAFAGIKAFGLDDSVGSWVDGLKEKFSGFRDEMEVQKSLAASSAAEYDGLGDAIGENEEQIGNVAAAFSTLEARSESVRKVGDAYRSVTARTGEFADRQRALSMTTGGVASQMRLASANVATFMGHVGGAAAGTVRGFGIAAGGVINALGGPLMVGVMAAGYAVTETVSAMRAADEQQSITADSAIALADAQRDMAKAFIESNGAIDDAVLGTFAAQLDIITEKQKALADSAPSDSGTFFGSIWEGMKASVGQEISWGSFFETDPFDAPFAKAASKTWDELGDLKEKADQAKAFGDALEELGLSSQDFAKKAGGSQSGWQELMRQVAAENPELEKVLEDQRDQMYRLQRMAKEIEPEYYAISDAIDAIGNAAGDSATRVDGLQTLLDILGGGEVSYTEELDKYREAIADLVEEIEKPVDKSKGIGRGLLDDDGRLNVSIENAKNLSNELRELAEASNSFAVAEYDRARAEGKSIPDAQAAARAALSDTERQLDKLGNKYDLGRDKINEFAEARGYSPDELIFHLGIEADTDDVTKTLADIRAQFSLADGESIKLPPIEDKGVRETLESLGFKIREIKDDAGKIVDIELSADSATAVTALDKVIEKTLEVDGSLADVKITADDSVFQFSMNQAADLIKQLDAEKANPAVGAILTKLHEGKALSLKELQELDKSTASPEVKALVAKAISDIDATQVRLNGLKGKTVTVTVSYQEVGRLAGKFGAWSPEALAAMGVTVSPGYVENYKPYDVDANGNKVYREAGGRLPAFAGGGRMPGHGPGTEQVDGIYAVTPEGRGIAMVNGKEWIINDEMSDRYDRELAMINAGTFPKLPGFEDGGRLVDSMTAVVRSQFPMLQMTSGLRFTDNGYHSKGAAADFSNVGAGAYSSPEMQALAAFIADRYPSQTVQLIHSPFDRNIGGGQFVGDGMGYYGSGTMAQHTDHVHWAVNSPVSVQTVGDGPAPASRKKKAKWEESDELDLRSAQIALQKARGELNPKENDKRTSDDFEQDRIDVRKAEIRVEELEAQKRAAAEGRDQPAPPAPELAGMTDKELDLLEAERRAERAERERNEVYADPEATLDDRQDADVELVRARNALDAMKKPDSESGVPQSWSDLAGELSKEFVASNVADILGYYGASDDMGPLMKAGAAVLKASEAGFMGEPGASAGEDVPEWMRQLIGMGDGPGEVMPQWLTDMLAMLQQPFRLYDTGGVWPSGTGGFNMSGHDELVLTHEQRAETGRDFALLRGHAEESRRARARSADTVAGRDPFGSARQTVVQLPNGFDPNAVASGIRKARQQEDFETAHVR